MAHWLFFHYCKSLWRRVQELSLSVMYKEDEDFRLHIQTHMALAFLPSDEVHTFATSLHQQYTDNTSIEQFHTYFSNTWLTGSFPVELWN